MTDSDDFLGTRKGPTVAHELGHAFDIGIGQKSEKAGFDKKRECILRPSFLGRCSRMYVRPFFGYSEKGMLFGAC